MAKRRQRSHTEIGFFSEHTAEFVLAPALAGILRSNFEGIVPMYFWSTREGARINLDLHNGTAVRIVEVFPRRPKFSYSGQRDILIKFNASILTYATQAESFGIPVLAGIPLVTSLFDLSFDCDTAWFHLRSGHQGTEDLYCRLTVPGGQILEEPNSDVCEGPMKNAALVRIAESARVMSWREAASALRELRRWSKNERNERFFPWIGGGYRTFQIILFAAQ